MTPRRIPTESIVSSFEPVLSRQRDLSESAKDNIRSRIASTVQSASIPDNYLTEDEQQALERLKNENNIVILPADKGRVTVVMDKTDYFDKMDALVNDKQTYEELKRDSTPALIIGHYWGHWGLMKTPMPSSAGFVCLHVGYREAFW